jgi:outer membrane protein TolC
LTYNQKQYLNVQEDQLNKEDRLSAQVTMPLFLSGLRAKRVQNLSKKSDQISSREKYQDKLEQTILDVTKQFFDLYLRKKDLEMIQSRYQFQKSLAKIVENKYRLGTFSKIELDRIGLEILRTEYDLQQTLYSIQKMERDFFVFLDIPPKDYVLKSDLENMEIEIPEIDPESIQTIFQKNTGLIQALRNLELSVQERKSVSLVSESVVFSRHEQKEPLLFSRDSRGEESSITFAGIKIPFQDPLSTLTKKDRLGRQIEQQKITIEQLTSQLLDKIENLKTDFSSYEINKKISQKSLQLSKKILDLDTFNYQRKAIPQDKLLESQQRYHQELYNYEKLKITAIQSTLDWERLLGHLKQGGIPSWLTKNM